MSFQVKALLSTMGDNFTPLASTAAYSLRLLNPTYTGPVVQVRRSSDNALNTFTASEIIDGTLISWVGAGNNGFVRIWYDQGSNIYHAGMGLNATQPQIVSNGQLVVVNSKPAIRFTSNNGAAEGQYLIVSNLSILQPITIFIVAKRDSVTFATDVFFDSNNTSNFFVFQNLGVTYTPNNAWQATAGTGTPSTITSTSLNNANLNLFTLLYNGASSAIYGNSSLLTSGNAGSGSMFGLTIGRVRPGLLSSAYSLNALDGHISEILIYNSNQTANRLAIEAGINSYYSIF